MTLLPLAGQLAAVAEDPGDAPGHEAHVVGDIGDERGVAEAEQHRERDQAAAADDRVDRPGGHSGSSDRQCFEQVHERRARLL